MARKELSSVGDPSLGEWEEITPVAYHLRRRISFKEQLKIGEAIDIRGTDEENERLRGVLIWINSSENKR